MSKNFSFTKINLSSMRVLYTLLLLFERDMTMEELRKCYKLYHNENISNFVMSKYINTCRYAGINVAKIKHKYTITNFPIGIKFTENEISLLNELNNCCEKFKLELLSENMRNILFKINKRSKKLLTPISDYRQKDSNIKLFESALWEHAKIRILTTEGKKLLCDPLDIVLDKDEIVFRIFIDGEAQEILPDKVATIKLLPQRTAEKYMTLTVIFELKGPLAKKYQIRENEQIVNVASNGDLTISNRYEDKFQLLHRLMRYGENCKLVSPKSYVKDMKDLINETLKNYKK